MTPQVVKDREKELLELCEKNPFFIPIPAAAEYLHMDAEGLRRGLENGTIDFGFAWQKEVGGYKGFKIPTLPFFNAMTLGHGLSILKEGATA